MPYPQRLDSPSPLLAQYLGDASRWTTEHALALGLSKKFDDMENELLDHRKQINDHKELITMMEAIVCGVEPRLVAMEGQTRAILPITTLQHETIGYRVDEQLKKAIFADIPKADEIKAQWLAFIQGRGPDGVVLRDEFRRGHEWTQSWCEQTVEKALKDCHREIQEAKSHSKQLELKQTYMRHDLKLMIKKLDGLEETVDRIDKSAARSREADWRFELSINGSFDRIKEEMRTRKQELHDVSAQQARDHEKVSGDIAAMRSEMLEFRSSELQ